MWDGQGNECPRPWPQLKNVAEASPASVTGSRHKGQRTWRSEGAVTAAMALQTLRVCSQFQNTFCTGSTRTKQSDSGRLRTPNVAGARNEVPGLAARGLARLGMRPVSQIPQATHQCSERMLGQNIVINSRSANSEPCRMLGLGSVTLHHDISSFCREGLQAHAANIPLPGQSI